MTKLPFAAEAPVSVSKIGLKAKDAGALAKFYSDVIGLDELSRRHGTIVLGAGGRPLLEIEDLPSAKVDDPRSAGLFHTAFLLPTRGDLARWMRNAIENRFAISGASDHIVSEAIYLDDPEGNGIEVYADRPMETWEREASGIKMATLPLDGRGLLGQLDAGNSNWSGIPESSIIGHVHLRVGDAAEAERWWKDLQGFETMAKYGNQAVFLATGGYHHHVGANSWRSGGSGKRDPDRAGLSFIEFSGKDRPERSDVDPWGTAIRVKSNEPATA